MSEKEEEIMLENYPSKCEIHRDIIKSEENGCVHYAVNPHCEYEVRQYHLDGEIITHGTRCDYLVLNDTKKDAYFIELKGTDIDKAVEQLKASIALIIDDIKGYKILLRIVCKRAKTIKMKSTTYRKAEREYSGRIKCKEVSMKEYL